MKKRISAILISALLILAMLALQGCELFCEHTYGEWVTELEPTCSEEGRRGRKCTECDKVDYEAIPPTGDHHSSKWVTDKEVTCEADGEKHKVCDDCGAIFDRMTVEKAHRFENDACLHCGISVDMIFTFTYSDYKDTYSIAENEDTTTPSAVILPSTYKGKRIDSVDYLGFSSNTAIKSVTIPEGYSTIGERAFYGCSNLSYLEMPDSITDIGSGAFINCGSIKGIRLSESLKEISSGMFESCGALESIRLPESITYIRLMAFKNCTSLKEIVIPDNVVYIGGEAFRNCSSLKSAVIGKKVNEIGRWAFNSGYALQSVVFKKCDGWSLRAYKVTNNEPVSLPLNHQDLENDFRAAMLLKQDYKDYVWERRY